MIDIKTIIMNKIIVNPLKEWILKGQKLNDDFALKKKSKIKLSEASQNKKSLVELISTPFKILHLFKYEWIFTLK